MVNKHLKYLLSLLLAISTCLNAKAQENKKVKQKAFDFSLNIKKNDSPYFTLSSDVSLVFIHQRISIDFGAGLIISTNDYKVYDETSWNFGFKILGDTIRKKFVRHFGLAFQRSKFKYDIVDYDYAVPHIPIRATRIHDVERNEFILCFGLRYLFTKKIFVQANGGITYSGYRDMEEESSNPDEAQKFKPVLQLYGCMGFGMTL